MVSGMLLFTVALYDGNALYNFVNGFIAVTNNMHNISIYVFQQSKIVHLLKALIDDLTE